MIKSRNEMPKHKIEIDLSGPEGNVYYLMGLAKKLSKQLYDDTTPEVEMNQIVAELRNELYGDDISNVKNMGEWIVNKMMESDYENAINVFDKYFGDFVILYR